MNSLKNRSKPSGFREACMYLEDEVDIVEGHGDTDDRVRPPPFAAAAAAALSAAGLA